MKNIQKVQITVAAKEHLKYSGQICQIIEESAKVRGTGIAKRETAYIEEKINDGKAVIAIAENGQLAGFCYIESWGSEKKYVANSGLIVNPEFRGLGLGNLIKKAAFDLSRKKFPNSKLFGITTSPAVMKINYHLGYRPVTLHQLTDDEEFWNGCKSCVNYDILMRTNRLHCLCTGMLYDPLEKQNGKEKDIKEQVGTVS
jgi:L-amino acid N-acyltransferase YncA